MSILQEVLKEEIQRLEKNVSSYERMLESLPKGSIFVRKMGGSSFVYRRRRENGRIISEYLGNVNESYAQKQIGLSEEYKRIKQNVRTAKSELFKLRKAYRVYERQ